MKRTISVFSVFVLLLTFAVSASAQRYANPRPCESRKKRVAKNALVGSGLGAIIGLISGGGRGAAIGAAAGGGAGAVSGIPNQPGCDRNASNENREYNDDARQQGQNNNMPDLRGQLVAVRFDQPNELSPFLENSIFQAFARFGARPIRQAPNSWGNVCERPGRKIICVTIGAAAMLTSASGNASVWMNIPGVPTNTGNGSWEQLYAVSVHIDLYDNPPPAAGENGWQQQQSPPLITPLATAEGIGDSRSGSSYLSTSTSGFGMSTTASQYNSYQLAGLAAANQAIGHLLRGNGWLPNAEDYLRGD